MTLPFSFQSTWLGTNDKNGLSLRLLAVDKNGLLENSNQIISMKISCKFWDAKNDYQYFKKNRSKQAEVLTCQGSEYKPVEKFSQWWVENTAFKKAFYNMQNCWQITNRNNSWLSKQCYGDGKDNPLIFS